MLDDVEVIGDVELYRVNCFMKHPGTAVLPQIVDESLGDLVPTIIDRG